MFNDIQKLDQLQWLPNRTNLTPILWLYTDLDFYRIASVSMGHKQRVWHASRETHILPDTRSCTFLWTCICSHCWDQFPRRDFPYFSHLCRTSPLRIPWGWFRTIRDPDTCTELDHQFYENFPLSIFDRCDMPAGIAYLSGPLFGTCTCSDCWDYNILTQKRFFSLFISLAGTNTLTLVCSSQSLSTFSILPSRASMLWNRNP